MFAKKKDQWLDKFVERESEDKQGLDCNKSWTLSIESFNVYSLGVLSQSDIWDTE